MKLLTEKARISCDHQTGSVEIFASQTLVFIQDARVLVATDVLMPKPILACPNIGPGLKPCALTVSPHKGLSELLFIDGQAACLDTLEGVTDGAPPPPPAPVLPLVPPGFKYRVRLAGQEFVEADA